MQKCCSSLFLKRIVVFLPRKQEDIHIVKCAFPVISFNFSTTNAMTTAETLTTAPTTTTTTTEKMAPVEANSTIIQQRRPLCPPASVRGMTVLDRSAFTVRVDLPTIYVPANRSVSEVGNRLKRYDLLLKYRVNSGRKRRIRDMPPDSESQDSPDDLMENHCNHSESLVPIVLNPEKVPHGFVGLPVEVQEFLGQYGVSPSCNYRMLTSTIDYSIWSKEDIFKAVLPEGEHTVSGYSIVGHIVHVNLKESLFPYKNLIGQVLLDKVPQAKTVINKVKNIDTAYRNFEIELLAGEANFKTRVKENGCLFDLDYAQVYWNSRLCTEHKRVVDLVKVGDLVIDGFAGIGPFAVLAAKTFATPVVGKQAKAKQSQQKQQSATSNGTTVVVAAAAADGASELPQETVTMKTAPVRVIANDLNPQSCYWLRRNVVLNKIPDVVAVHNLDAAEFIQTIVKTELSQFLATSTPNAKAHIIMNLPATAVTFLPCFLGLLSDCSVDMSRFHVMQRQNGCSPVKVNSSNGRNNGGEDGALLIGNGKRGSSRNASNGDLMECSSGSSSISSSSSSCDSNPLPIFLYCYTFSRSDDPVNDAVRQACDALGWSFPADPALIFGHDVRNVAPNKQMICIQVQLTERTLFEVRQRPPSGHRSSPD